MDMSKRYLLEEPPSLKPTRENIKISINYTNVHKTWNRNFIIIYYVFAYTCTCKLIEIDDIKTRYVKDFLFRFVTFIRRIILGTYASTAQSCNLFSSLRLDQVETLQKMKLQTMLQMEEEMNWMQSTCLVKQINKVDFLDEPRKQ